MGWRRRLRRPVAVLLLLTSPVLLLSLAEMALRVLGIGAPAEYLVRCNVGGREGSCDNERFTAQFFGQKVFRSGVPFFIPASKPAGTYRICILGESVAAGIPDPAYGFSRYLEVMLRTKFPKTRFEIVTAAITAIDSHVLLPMARELATQRFDLFVLYIGNNEIVGPYGPQTVFASAAGSLPIIRASIALRSTRVGQLLDGALRGADDSWQGMAKFHDWRTRADDAAIAQARRNFAINLREIVDAAKDGGARVLLSTIATNLKDSSPFVSLHRPGLGAEQLAEWQKLYAKGVAREDSGGCADALSFFEAAARIDDRFADLHFRIATCRWRQGELAAARLSFLRARDEDVLQFRADSGINAEIRAVAASSGEGVELLDTENLLDRVSKGGSSGSDLFWEHVHFRPQTNYRVAESIAGRIIAAAAGRFGAERRDINEVGVERVLALTRFDRVRLARETIAELQQPPFTERLDNAAAISFLAREAQRGDLDFNDVDLDYGWATAKSPADMLLHYSYARFLQTFRQELSASQSRGGLPADWPVLDGLTARASEQFRLARASRDSALLLMLE